MTATLNRLSSEKETMLINTLRDIIRDTRDGVAANDAIAKRAQEQGLNPDFICRLVEAFNTSKTLSHLKTAELDRKADFIPGLADKAEVLRILYEGKEKKARLIADDLTEDLNEEKQEHFGLTKAAFSLANVPALPDISFIHHRAKSLICKLNRISEDANMELRMAKEAAFQAAKMFVESFRYTDDRTAFNDIEDAVRWRLGDQLGKQAMDLVWNLGQDRLGKTEERLQDRSRTVKLFGANRREKAAKNFCDKLENAAGMAKKAGVISEQAKQIATSLQEKLEAAIKFSSQKDAQSPGLASLENIAETFVGKPMKTVSEAYDAVKELIEKKPEIKQILTPEHFGELRKIQVQSMINELITSDPILSKYPPRDVINAFNLISQSAPSLVTNPLLTRSLIARVLQQSGRLDPSEAEQLLRLEGMRRETGIKGY